MPFLSLLRLSHDPLLAYRFSQESDIGKSLNIGFERPERSMEEAPSTTDPVIL